MCVKGNKNGGLTLSAIEVVRITYYPNKQARLHSCKYGYLFLDT